MFYNFFNDFLFFNYILNLSYNDYNTCFYCNKNLNYDLSQSLRTWHFFNINVYGKLCQNCNHNYKNFIFKKNNKLSKNLYPKFFYDKSFIFKEFIYHNLDDDINDYQFLILGDPCPVSNDSNIFFHEYV